jgi:hypothetical protein
MLSIILFFCSLLAAVYNYRGRSMHYTSYYITHVLEKPISEVRILNHARVDGYIVEIRSYRLVR